MFRPMFVDEPIVLVNFNVFLDVVLYPEEQQGINISAQSQKYLRKLTSASHIYQHVFQGHYTLCECDIKSFLVWRISVENLKIFSGEIN